MSFLVHEVFCKNNNSVNGKYAFHFTTGPGLPDPKSRRPGSHD